MLSASADFIANVVYKVKNFLSYFNVFQWCTRPQKDYNDDSDDSDDMVTDEISDDMEL